MATETRTVTWTYDSTTEDFNNGNGIRRILSKENEIVEGTITAIQGSFFFSGQGVSKGFDVTVFLEDDANNVILSSQQNPVYLPDATGTAVSFIFDYTNTTLEQINSITKIRFYSPTDGTYTNSSGETKNRLIYIKGTQTVTIQSEVKTSHTISYHNGTEWIECEVYYHDGEKWILCDPYYHNGEEWTLCSSS